MATTLAEYKHDASTLDLEAFSQRHGDAFLLLEGVVSDLKPPERAWQHTMGSKKSEIRNGGFFADTIVFAVRYSGRSSSPQFVTIGRSATSNDITVMDESISGFHAFFERGPDGEFFILDFNSKNGTFVNRKRIDSNVPVSITSGDFIRVGNVSFLFLLTREFLEFARHSSR